MPLCAVVVVVVVVVVQECGSQVGKMPERVAVDNQTRLELHVGICTYV